MVEAQEVSHELCKKTVAYNDLTDRVELRLGDMRDPKSVPEHNYFDLVTEVLPIFQWEKV